MGLVKKLSKGLGLEKEEVDVEDFLDSLNVGDQDIFYEEADFYVKPMTLENANDVKAVLDEITKGNIVLLNFGPLMLRNKVRLKQSVSEIKTKVLELNGDVARITEEKLIVTPAKVKIVKRR
ncbi:MAG: cell division protein SepF [Candidatus Diapherotrites archaeon]|nr:cell division protein SepF [Candidatus Diapherotrites archaeon]